MEVQLNNWILQLLLVFLVVNLFHHGEAIQSEEVSRKATDKNGRFLSMFEIINFPNEACKGDSKNGTCYTSQECEDKGGTKDGDCASGYGVCCVFSAKCGARSSENNTYFDSSGSESSGTCSIQICPPEGICQLRLDMTTFVISGPYTSTDTTAMVGKMQNGGVAGGTTGVDVMMTNSQCTVDSFSVTSAGGGGPPTICGTNSNEHMYVDASANYCNTLSFSLGSATGTSRSWSIQVQQFECDYNNLAPTGCTQYYFGQSSGTFRTFNYQSGSGKHLASQNQNVCFRREKGNTKICYSSATFTDFEITYNANAKGYVGDAKSCCGYNDGAGANGYDCLVIPSAINAKSSLLVDKDPGHFCGAGGLVSQNSKLATDPEGMVTICSKRTPFSARFVSDSFETADEAKGANGIGGKGFQLAYILS